VHEECIVCSAIWLDTSQAEVILHSKKIKPIALAIIELRESEGIRQAVSQSVKILLNKLFLKFHSNFLKTFRVI